MITESSITTTQRLIIQQVADSYGYTVSEITSGQKLRNSQLECRHMMVLMLRLYEEMKLQDLCDLLGYNAHREVRHSYKRASQLVETEDRLNDRLTTIKRNVYGSK